MSIEFIFGFFATIAVIAFIALAVKSAKRDREVRQLRKAFVEYAGLSGIQVRFHGNHFSFASGGCFGGDISKNPATKGELRAFIEDCGRKQSAVEKHLGIKLTKVPASVENKPEHYAVSKAGK